MVCAVIGKGGVSPKVGELLERAYAERWTGPMLKRELHRLFAADDAPTATLVSPGPERDGPRQFPGCLKNLLSARQSIDRAAKRIRPVSADLAARLAAAGENIADLEHQVRVVYENEQENLKAMALFASACQQ